MPIKDLPVWKKASISNHKEEDKAAIEVTNSIKKESWFLDACDKLPTEEVEHAKITLNRVLDEEVPETFLRGQLVELRFSNPICEMCKKSRRDGSVRFVCCSTCHLVFYCEEHVKKTEELLKKKLDPKKNKEVDRYIRYRNIHSNYCGKKDAPMNKHYAVVLGEVGDK